METYFRWDWYGVGKLERGILMETKFAPAERDPAEKVINQGGIVEALPLIREIFNAVPNVLAILNSKRQIVFANRALLQFMEIDDPRRILGRRPGEALKCSHSGETEGGCGTTESCRMCGMVNAILSAQNGAASTQECRILREDDGSALDLRIQTTPFQVKGTPFTVLAVENIADEKRRKVLERIFYGGLLGTAQELRSDAEQMYMGSIENLEDRRAAIFAGSEKLVADINGQRILTAAEAGELKPRPSQFSALKLANEIIAAFQDRATLAGITLRLDPKSEDTQFVSERTLLKLVLTHLVTNAMEACTKIGDTVTLGCRIGRNSVEIFVHNPGEVADDVALQIFQRSFSTKGKGRGIGTYAVKLLTERYLKGKVIFTTSPGGGTTFRVACPRVLAV